MFNPGDIVKYVSGEWGDSFDNPLYGGVYGFIGGRVVELVEIQGLPPINVDWDNGGNNSYNEMDLELLNVEN